MLPKVWKGQNIDSGITKHEKNMNREQTDSQNSYWKILKHILTSRNFRQMPKLIQVSLAIRRGLTVPEKSQNANNKTGILGPN